MRDMGYARAPRPSRSGRTPCPAMQSGCATRLATPWRSNCPAVAAVGAFGEREGVGFLDVLHDVTPRDHNAAFLGTCSRSCHGMCICGRASGHHTAIRGASVEQCAPVVATSVTRPQDLARTRPYAKKCVPVTPPRSLSCAKGSDPCDTMRQKRPGGFCLIDLRMNPSTIGWLVEASIRYVSRLLAATVWLSTPPLELEE